MDKMLTDKTNKYLQMMTEREPSISGMEVMFYEELDADRDGNTEIIAAYGDRDSLRICFVLREVDGDVRVVKQNFYQGVYDCHSIELARFGGSDCYYIVAGVTNYGEMNGLNIYEITKDDVRCISDIRSAAGISCAYLSDQQSDGSYGGFTTERFGQDVYYYEVLTDYRFADGTFIQLPSRINVRDYPQAPAEAVIQYLSLKCLNRNYFSGDIVKRLLEIRDSRFYFYFSLDYMIWGVRIANYTQGIDTEEAPGLHINESVDGEAAVVLVQWSDHISNEIHKVEFSLVSDRAKWCITDIKETVDAESPDGCFQFRTVDVNQTYLGTAGYTELDLRLPELGGSYAGISAINQYFAGKKASFHKEMISKVNPRQQQSEHMKGRETNHYRSADYCFTAKKGNLISIMAYLDGGSGKTSWAGKEGHTFDLVSGNRLKLSDLFHADEEEYLDAIYTCIAKKASLNIRTSLAQGNKSPYSFHDAYSPEGMRCIQRLDRNDFYLTDYALVVFYSEQEMSVSGAGVQTFEIPYGEISDLLVVQVEDEGDGI